MDCGRRRRKHLVVLGAATHARVDAQIGEQRADRSEEPRGQQPHADHGKGKNEKCRKPPPRGPARKDHYADDCYGKDCRAYIDIGSAMPINIVGTQLSFDVRVKRLRCRARKKSPAMTTPNAIGWAAVLDTRLITDLVVTSPNSELADRPGMLNNAAISTR